MTEARSTRVGETGSPVDDGGGELAELRLGDTAAVTSWRLAVAHLRS